MSKYQALIDALAGVDGQLGKPSLHSGHVIYAETEEWCSVDINVKLSANKHISGPLARFIKEAANPSTIRALLADLERAERALNRIASWSEGEQVTPSFDEPNAASIARDYLGGVSDADGAQTSPIPCDVFSGGSLFKKGAPICDLAEHIDTEAARLVWAMANMGMSNDHSRNFTTHVLRVGGIGDIHDCRTYIDAALAQMAGGG